MQTNRLATALLAFALVHARASCAQDVAQRADSLFARYNASPGVAVAVIRDGAMIFSKGYGLADIEHRVPITPASVFDLASLAKQFTGLSIAMLVEQKKIDLADNIRKYIPEMHDGRTITIDHLLHHTSGLRDWPGSLALAGWRMDDVISYDQILRMAYNQRTLNFEPGAEYTYSNTGYNLLAETVARVTGKSFSAWTTENLFKPLGMNSTVFRDDHTSIVANRALGYELREDKSFRSIPDNLTAVGSSSIFSNVEDLAKWIANFDDAKVGGRAAMDRTRTRGTLNSGATIPYAFGVNIGTYRGLPTVTHGGSWAQFATSIIYFPSLRLGVVVLANSSSINAAAAANRLADLYLPATAAPLPNATNSLINTVADVPARILDEYAGIYRLGPGWYVDIKRVGSALTIQATNEGRVPMIARTERDFWIEAYCAPMDFERNAAGQVIGLNYRGIKSPRMEAKGDSLTIVHFRHGSAPLTWTWSEFNSPWWFLKSVAFERDARGRVTGFVANIDERSRNIRFTRRE